MRQLSMSNVSDSMPLNSEERNILANESATGNNWVLRAPSLDYMESHAYGHMRAYATFDSFKRASEQCIEDSGRSTPRFTDSLEDEKKEMVADFTKVNASISGEDDDSSLVSEAWSDRSSDYASCLSSRQIEELKVDSVSDSDNSESWGSV